MKELAELQLFSLLKKIPYENVSKILRLFEKPENRPRSSQTVLREYQENRRGGTCFSLVNLVVRSLKIEGIHAFPVKADIHRRTFPHFFVIIDYNNKNYLVDPGYLINEPIELKEINNINKAGSAISFELKKISEEKYSLSTISSGIKKERYNFSINEVSKEEFWAYWIKSFDYINEIVASRHIDNKFIYINGHYVQIRSNENLEKYRSAEKSYEYLNTYFHLDHKLIIQAEETLEFHKNYKQ
ncbi:MAG: arylamine N-acetyltransferase [Candidatus Neomarinimicrobiota bacterium]